MFIHFNYRVFFAQYTLKDETIWTSWIVKYNCLIQHHSKSPYIFIIILSALKNGVIDCGTRQQWTSIHLFWLDTFWQFNGFSWGFCLQKLHKLFFFFIFHMFYPILFGNILCIPFSVRFRIIEKNRREFFSWKDWDCSVKLHFASIITTRWARVVGFEICSQFHRQHPEIRKMV